LKDKYSASRVQSKAQNISRLEKEWQLFRKHPVWRLHFDNAVIDLTTRRILLATHDAPPFVTRGQHRAWLEARLEELQS
jgi:hypothetical protein